MLSWISQNPSGHVLSYATLDTDGWSKPATVAQGNDWFVNWADFPSVVQLSEEVLAAHWLRKKIGGPYAYDVNVSIKTNNSTWSAPFTPHQDATATEHGFVSLFAVHDQVGAVWLDGRNTQPQTEGHAHQGMTLRGGVLSAEGPISEVEIDPMTCDCCQTDVALVDSNPVVVYRDRDPEEIRDINIVRFEDNAWTAPERLYEDGWKIRGCPVNGPAIDARQSTVAVAWFSAPDASGRVMLSLSHDGGKVFHKTVEVAPSRFGRVDVAVLPNNRIAVLWMGATQKEAAAIKLQIFTPELNTLREKTLYPLQASRASGFPQMIATDSHLVFAWTDIGDPTTIKTGIIKL